MDLSLADFEENLSNFHEIVRVHTISMHGLSFSNFDNGELWNGQNKHQKLLGLYL